jgi:hypothetical protein
MPCKTVTFDHRCIICGGFLYVPCGIAGVDDCSTCFRCIRVQKSPRKTVPLAVSVAAAIDSTPAGQHNTTSAEVLFQGQVLHLLHILRLQVIRNRKEMEQRPGLVWASK